MHVSEVREGVAYPRQRRSLHDIDLPAYVQMTVHRVGYLASNTSVFSILDGFTMKADDLRPRDPYCTSPWIGENLLCKGSNTGTCSP